MVVVLEAKRSLDIAAPVRLSDAVWKAVRADARVVGVGPSTLVRIWVRERLRQKPGPAPQAWQTPATLSRDVSALSHL